MDNQRLFLYAALGLISLVLWQQWQFDYNSPTQPQTSQNSSVQNTQQPNNNPATAGNTSDGNIPTAPQPTSANSQQNNDLPKNINNNAVDNSNNIKVLTDLFEVSISPVGGTIQEIKLKKYPVTVKDKNNVLKLMTTDPINFFIAQSGLSSASKDLPAPAHTEQYQTDNNSYILQDNQDTISVPLKWQKNGIEVVKTYVFKKDSYQIESHHTIKNNTNKPFNVSQYHQLQRVLNEDKQSGFLYTYTGGVLYNANDKYQKVDFDEFSSNQNQTNKDGWLAMIEHYFLAAWLPVEDETNTYYTKTINNNNPRYILGKISQSYVIPANTAKTLKSTLYAGPKIQKRLEQAPVKDLKLTVDYGILTIIADPIFWVLDKIHSFVGNWGWSIVLITILIKLLLYKLSATSYRSMAKMKKLAPKIQSLKNRYGDDKQKMGVAQMELFKKEKVNPLGGCLPVVAQIPVFIALYWVLLETVELRQAPFMLWITDLSAKDPYFVLPITMGITMFLQQKLNPAPADPMQQKLFMALPFVFTVFFAFFPAGLVLYWLMNNVISIAQQYYITRGILNTK
ncbi:MAG: membrane protein insertase YidC [Gammaproteobacteria bacterium]|nr:MAG: membrane protein insertase YidC [Gammaproteobacteria bacterium]